MESIHAVQAYTRSCTYHDAIVSVQSVVTERQGLCDHASDLQCIFMIGGEREGERETEYMQRG